MATKKTVTSKTTPIDDNSKIKHQDRGGHAKRENDFLTMRNVTLKPSKRSMKSCPNWLNCFQSLTVL